MQFLQFNQSVIDGPGTATVSQHLWEIIIMLLVAFILGYLLRLFLTRKYKYEARDLRKENLRLNADLENTGGVDNTVDINSIELKLKDLEQKNKVLVETNNQLQVEKSKLKMDMNSSLTSESNDSKVKEGEIKIEQLERTVRVLKSDLDECQNEKSKFKAMSTLDEDVVDSKKVEKKIPVAEKTVKSTSDEGKDNLTKIEGIGPKIQEHLNNAEIFTFKKLGNTEVSFLQEILDNAGPLYKVHSPDTWPEQASLAAKGEWISLSKWQDELKGGKRI